MDAFAWGVLGTVAGVVGTAATIVFGVIPFLHRRRDHEQIHAMPVHYNEAVTQLGSHAPEVRIAGIRTLESIALNNSERSHQIVMEVLIAFIREHSLTPPGVTRPNRWPPPDVRAALTVVRRRKPEHGILTVDLAGADLHGADLHGANLTQTDGDIPWRRERRAPIPRVPDLTCANLTGADLHGANLYDVSLDLTNFDGADLTGARWPADTNPPEGWTAAGKVEKGGFGKVEKCDFVRLRRANT